MSNWASDAVFYHLYPLGACGAPARNDFCSPPVPRLERLFGHLDHLQALGVTAVYLGPVFESTAHGYDTADYFHVDRRLGDEALLRRLVDALHRRGMRVVLDGVFNHVGRDFWAFRELRERGEAARHRAWFRNLQFGRQSPWGDPFTYEAWAGCFDLVKLELRNPEVRGHLFDAVAHWLRAFDIDGLRLDAADVMDPDFLRELAGFCRARRPDFWLVGEIVHGDYRRLANPETLDSVTNYECYKGLWSSLNDRNYFEIAYAIDRQFGPGGLYRGLPLYNFADNHDVDRVASSLRDPRHLWPLYLLLFTMPGVPSIYYGSEHGLTGRKQQGDAALRPELPAPDRAGALPFPELSPFIGQLARIRRQSAALRRGSYRELVVQPERFAFLREHADEAVVVALSSATEPSTLEVPLPGRGGQLVDLLDGRRFPVGPGAAPIELAPCSGRILRHTVP
jgi:cyclomaltodextrinase